MLGGRLKDSRSQLLQDLENQGSKDLFDYWGSLYEQTHATPKRTLFDPLVVLKYTPHLWVIHYDQSTNKFTFRLAGDHIVDFFGVNPVNKPLEEIYLDKMVQQTEEFFFNIIKTPAIVLNQGHRYMRKRNYPLGYERVGFPMLDETGDCTHIIGASYFYGLRKLNWGKKIQKNVYTRNQIYAI